MVRRESKLAPKVVMPVDLFGQPADYRKIGPIVKREGLLMLCDTGTGLRRDIGWEAHRRDRRCGGDQFLSGKAARLLWRRWGMFHQ